MEELVKHIKRITQQGTARKIMMDINDKQSTTSVTQLDIPRVAWPSSSEALPSAPLSTIADIQRSLEPSNIGAPEGTAPDTAAEVLRNIVLELKKDERWQFFSRLFYLVLLLPVNFYLIPGAFAYFNQRISGINKMGKSGIWHMIRLEGEQWSRYVQHTFADSTQRMKNAAKKRSLARGYGHVLFGSQCLLLDSLISMTYEKIMAVRTEVITAPNMVDMMLRVCGSVDVLLTARLM